MTGVPRYNAAVDGNQKLIVDVLRAAGITVEQIREPVDLLCGIDGCNILLEVKSSEKAPLTERQRLFVSEWRGQVAVVWTPRQALDAVYEHCRYRSAMELQEQK